MVSPDAIEQATTFLQELPEKPKEDLSLREAVGQMQESLKAALAKGYSYEELAQMLAGQGIQISAFTLKNYVPSGKRSVSKGKPRKTKKDQADEAIAPMASLTMDEPEEEPDDMPEETPEETPEEAPPEEKPTRTRRAPSKTATTAKTPGTRRRKLS
ncbi:MAG: hypothetical protein NW220_17750 [Leptolyngbyaceae cyanobacterium bins.349]|nr:hypothetical protein [Leptolyngbyaceae cyanobacterium bins.349]